MSQGKGIIKGTNFVRDEGHAGSSAGERQSYASTLVDTLRAEGYRHQAGRLTLLLAEQFVVQPGDGLFLV